MNYLELLNSDNTIKRSSICKFASEMQEISTPLLGTGIDDISYVEFDSERKSGFCLISVPETARVYIQNNALPLEPYLSLKKELPAGFYQNIYRRGYRTSPCRKLLTKLNEYTQHKDGCVVIRDYKDGRRGIYHFVSFYTETITCYEAIEAFTQYFEDKA